MTEVHLAPDIRTYVFFPIFVVVLGSSMIRSTIMEMVKSEPKMSLKDIKESQTLARSRLLRENGKYITEKGYRVRHTMFLKPNTGTLLNPPPVNLLYATKSVNPSQMMEQPIFLGFNTLLSYIINFIFSGFVVAKLPFTLAYGFKYRLQSDIDVPSLDISYVSSQSLYLFMLIGCWDLMKIINSFRGADSQSGRSDLEVMAMPGRAGAQPMGVPNADMNTMYTKEKEILESAEYEWKLVDIEMSLLNEK